MRYILLLVFALSISTSVSARVIKTCHAVFQPLVEGIPSQKAVITIRQTPEKYIGTSRIGEEQIEDEVLIREYPIRKDLELVPPPREGFEKYALNLGENLVHHAMIVEKDDLLKDIYSSGLNLREVVRVKVYQIGEISPEGVMALVEGINSSGKSIGTFVGGVLVAPCE